MEHTKSLASTRVTRPCTSRLIAQHLNKTGSAESYSTTPMSIRSLLALTCVFVSTALIAAEAPRFSQSLTTEQRTTTGIDRLNSDQIAALDALVRLNRNQIAADALKAEQAKHTAQKKSAATTEITPLAAPESASQPVAFSKSLSADQRRAAGLDTLTAEQQAAVDSLVAVQTTEAPRYEPVSASAVDAVEFFPNRFEMHGEVGFSFGGGSGGYSSRAAWVSSTLLDTKTGTEFSVGVLTSREKWKRPFGYRDDWDDVGFGLSTPIFGNR